MADQPNVFNAPTGDTTIVIDTNVDPFADKLKTLLGPDGKPKYATTAVALDALSASQAHIATLEAEKAAERAEIERLREIERNSKTLEEIVERLKTNTTPEKVTPAASGVDENTVTKLVQKTLEERDRQSQAQANIKRVNDVLIEKFKDKATEAVAQKATELGMTPQELGALSSRNPQLVLTLFGSTNQSTPNPTTTSVYVPGSTPPEELKRPEKSILSGANATIKNQKELMAQIKAKVYKDLDVTT